MDPVKMKFALALWLSLGFAVVGPVSAQSSMTASDLSAIVDGIRGRCGLGFFVPNNQRPNLSEIQGLWFTNAVRCQ